MRDDTRTGDDIAAVFREEGDRVLATLIRLLGDFDLAEDGRQEAFAVALARWPVTGMPSNPRAWLVNTGRNKAIDRLRRRIALRGKVRLLGAELALAQQGDTAPGELDEIADDRLRLIFTCCHPALAREAQIALTLRTICGLTTQEISRGFLVPEKTMAQRLVCAKSKIRDACIPYAVPSREVLGERLEGVLAVVYLIFTEGYAATAGEALVRRDLCNEAIRLARLLVALMPERAEINALLALMLLHDARRDTRAMPDGGIILLEAQDRSLWDKAQIADGLARVDAVLHVPGRPSSYAVQAAIAALHMRAQRYEDTDWPQIAGLYQVLLRLYPSPVVELNHAAAVSMVDGPEAALRLVDSLSARGELAGYHLLPALRGELLRRLGRKAEAEEAYRAALNLVTLEPERRFLERRLSKVC